MTEQRPRILAIDDTPANLLTLGAALAADFDLQTATSGAAGIALALRSPPDLILLDVMMPRMDGFETCRRIRLEPTLRDVPIVFVTAMSAYESEVEGLALGASDYIAKPINVEIARHRISNLIERESLRKEVESQRDQLATLLRERERAEERLRVAAVAFDTLNGMMITDARGVILKTNRSFTRLTGYSEVEAVGRTPAMLKSGRHDRAFYQRMWSALTTKGDWQGEIWNRHKNGRVFAEMLTITSVRGAHEDITHYIATFTNITEDKQAAAEIHRLAYYDALTRLPNRRLLHERLAQALAVTAKSGALGALLFIDLDNFRALNDTRGHDLGDQLLCELAQRMQTGAREGDTVARLGGDEFVVLMEALSADPGEAARLALSFGEKLLGVAGPQLVLHGQDYKGTMSIGACLFAGGESIEDLFKRAELALYRAKDAGRNRLCFFEPAMQVEIDRRSQLETDLSLAVVLGQLELFYQPQIDSAGRTAGVEGLLRWRHAQRGLVPPGDFIPLAEASGLIVPIGYWALEAACATLARWAGEAHTRALQVAVNVSAQQFRQPDFVARVERILASSGADPQRLKLELTESAVLADVDASIEKMLEIKALGVSLSMDDFGTGYSSLSYLALLPIDQLKIDQSFVRNLPGAAKDESIARTIISLGRELSVNVVAEGVETAAQHAFLAAHGCHGYQGYLFSRPLPIAELEAFLRRE
jgi:diguanylate cyclase (GGDEF)-like protein/PAS domain S-box-containing protein